MHNLGVVQRGQRSKRVGDGFGGELGNELAAKSLVADGRAQQLEPISEALHLGREGVRGVVPEEHHLVLHQVQLQPEVRAHLRDHTQCRSNILGAPCQHTIVQVPQIKCEPRAFGCDGGDQLLDDEAEE